MHNLKNHKNLLQKQDNGFIEAKKEFDIITLFVNSNNKIKIDFSISNLTLNRKCSPINVIYLVIAVSHI